GLIADRGAPQRARGGVVGVGGARVLQRERQPRRHFARLCEQVARGRREPQPRGARLAVGAGGADQMAQFVGRDRGGAAEERLHRFGGLLGGGGVGWWGEG